MACPVFPIPPMFPIPPAFPILSDRLAVRNSNWVCFDCRESVRRPAWGEGPVPCPSCGKHCWNLRCRIPIPPKRAVKR